MAQKNFDDDFDLPDVQIAAADESSSAVTNLVMALWTGALPAFCFASMLGVPLAENAIIFLGATALSAFTLFKAYGSRGGKWSSKLLAERQLSTDVRGSRKKTNQERKELNQKQAERVARSNAESRSEAHALSLLYNNVYFLFFTVFFGFFLFKGYEGRVNYGLTTAATCALTHIFSTTTKKEKRA